MSMISSYIYIYICWLFFLQKKFSFLKNGEPFVLKSQGNKWKDYNCEIKGYYMSKYKTKDSLLKNKSNLIGDKWIDIVCYYLSDKAKV